ncbi:MAG: F0F1 ATP synthase subunit B [Calditrichaeota bacterium]|nr:F0F1 ATP synthase subunit B [Calditrichota bacterium]HQU74641.1 F0F1 ATP synthase subunit B [Calditrichia bacterium]
MELLTLNPGMLIWLVITFVVFAFVLSRVAWKPLLGAVQAREEGIANAIKQAEEARSEAEKVLAEQQAKLASVQDEIQALRKENKAMAEQMKAEIIAKAHEDAQKLRDRTHEELGREREAAIAALKEEVADLVVQTTAKLVGVTVDKSQHAQLIDESIRQFGQKN